MTSPTKNMDDDKCCLLLLLCSRTSCRVASDEHDPQRVTTKVLFTIKN